jgi:hypothetical protein
VQVFPRPSLVRTLDASKSLGADGRGYGCPHQTQRPAQLSQRAEILATVATLARRQVILERCSQEAVASAHRICHVSRLRRARRRVAADRRWGRDPGPLAWFAVEGMIDDRVVRAIWTDGQLSCDRALESRARFLVDLGAEFGSDDLPPRSQQLGPGRIPAC